MDECTQRRRDRDGMWSPVKHGCLRRARKGDGAEASKALHCHVSLGYYVVAMHWSVVRVHWSVLRVHLSVLRVHSSDLRVYSALSFSSIWHLVRVRLALDLFLNFNLLVLPPLLF